MSGYPVNRFMAPQYSVSSAVGGDAANPAAGDVTRPAEESPSARASIINSLCKGTLCPDQYMTSPVAKNYPQVTKVQMKESTTIKVNAPFTANPGLQVSADPSTGIILINWKEGPSAGIYHMGILPGNSEWSNADSYDPGIKNALTYGFNTIQSGVVLLRLNSALALPYNRSSQKQIRLTSTNLAQNFTRSRYYSGRISVVSDTVQLNAAIAAGNITASVITETEGVAQNTAGDDCYSVSDIVNGSRWKPETVQAHSLMDGVTVVQGPDIIEEMPPVDQINRNRTDGAWQSLADQIGFNTQRIATTPLPPNTTSGVITPIWGTWISPSNVVGSPGASGTGYLFGNAFGYAVFDPIPEMQMISLRVRAPYNIQLPGTWQSDSNFRSWIVCEHFFGSLNANGQLVLQTIADTQTVGEGSLTSLVLGPGSSTNFRLADCSVGLINIESDPRAEYVRRRNAGNDPGKYIGTQVVHYFSTYNQVAGDSPIIFRIGAQDSSIGTAGESVFEVCAVTLNTEQSGPYTVIRYDEVAVGQNIRINSLVNTENVSKSALSVIAPTDVYDVCYDMNAYALLNSLYFGPHTDFRCCWTNSNYRKLLGKLANWRLQDLIQTTTQSPRTMQIAEAAGLFDGLKSFGRGLLGVGRTVMQNPMVRQLARHAIDGVVAHIPHPLGRELAHQVVNAGLNQFGQSRGDYERGNEVLSQDGTTSGEARGYFGDQGWMQ